MKVLETERLTLRHFTDDDAPFILELLNEPAFIQNIGDKGVRNLQGARDYLQQGPIASYQRHGFGLYLVQRSDTGESVGMCGLLKRDSLEDADIGYAFLQTHRGKGYASEAATAVIKYAQQTLALPRIVAVVLADNLPSVRVLEKAGLSFEKLVRLTTDGEDLCLYSKSSRVNGKS
jgi:RimJ/RimL family protein N-acetyltransferase